MVKQMYISIINFFDNRAQLGGGAEFLLSFVLLYCYVYVYVLTHSIILAYNTFS